MRLMKMLALLVIILGPLMLTSCGKRSRPQPPGPAQDITYPRPYPPE